MTTSTDKPVSRVTIMAYSGQWISKRPRKIVVTIQGDSIYLRLQRTKQVERVDISEAFARARSERLRALIPATMRRGRKTRRSK